MRVLIVMPDLWQIFPFDIHLVGNIIKPRGYDHMFCFINLFRGDYPVMFLFPINFQDFFKQRSEEHTSELQSLMRISYAVFCLTKKNTHHKNSKTQITINTYRQTKQIQNTN